MNRSLVVLQNLDRLRLNIVNHEFKNIPNEHAFVDAFPRRNVLCFRVPKRYYFLCSGELTYGRLSDFDHISRYRPCVIGLTSVSRVFLYSYTHPPSTLQNTSVGPSRRQVGNNLHHDLSVFRTRVVVVSGYFPSGVAYIRSSNIG